MKQERYAIIRVSNIYDIRSMYREPSVTYLFSTRPIEKEYIYFRGNISPSPIDSIEPHLIAAHETLTSGVNTLSPDRKPNKLYKHTTQLPGVYLDFIEQSTTGSIDLGSLIVTESSPFFILFTLGTSKEERALYARGKKGDEQKIVDNLDRIKSRLLKDIIVDEVKRFLNELDKIS